MQNGTNKGKGKGRADPVDEEGEEEDDVEMGNGAGSEEEEELTPEQLKLRKRETKANYRKLQAELEETRANLIDVSVEQMAHQVERANVLFKDVQGPGEAVLDSRVLMAASDAGATKARQMKIDANAFDTDDFLAKLVSFMGGRLGMNGMRTRGVMDEDEGLGEGQDERELQGWENIGAVLGLESRRVPVMDFMNGVVTIPTKDRKVRPRVANNKPAEADRVRPDDIDASDITKDPQETTKMVAAIGQVLGDCPVTGMPFLAFIINPDSFAQSVENMFYFSFLVREEKAAIEMEEGEDSENYGDAIVFRSEQTTAEDKAKGAKKRQLIFELTEEVWRGAILAYNLTESFIPTRQKVHVAVDAWNGLPRGDAV